MKTRILIIDDEPEYSGMLKAQLESAGYFLAYEENNETHAITAARQCAPDIILLDVMMPRLEGSEVAALFREDTQFRNTPILFLTALVSEDDAPAGSYASGGHTFLPKALPLAKLIDCINGAIQEAEKAVTA